MALRFCVLASGSAGNATLLEAGDFGLLLDAGLGPRVLAGRLKDADSSWQRVRAVLLTHTHSDHFDDATFTHLWRNQVPLYCHPSHHGTLEKWSRGFSRLKESGLVRDYETGRELELAPGLRCLPLPVRHDSGEAFGFRLEGVPDLFGAARSVAYASDLGCWDESLARSLADVDLLAIEFNHDVGLQCSSGRSPRLIARVLGDEGHLSNEQACDLVRAVLRHSTPGRLSHLVQLHLSRECNRPSLAEDAARAVLRGLAVNVHTASQDEVGPSLVLGAGGSPPRRRRALAPRRTAPAAPAQPWLHGLE
jgi:phosphoribosyl 1,2-cyclic phosphodiesterase